MVRKMWRQGSKWYRWLNWKYWKRNTAWILIWFLFLSAWIPCFPALQIHGAVQFGGLKYEENLVQQWDAMAALHGMERTDLQNHYTSTYPNPRVIASVKQQTGFSPGGAWSNLEYRNVYCVSHSGEAANNPVSSMICSSAWYAKEPWTLQNLPDYMRNCVGGDAYRLRFNFLMLAYGADYHAYQGGVNSDSIAGTAEYYLCQGICTLTEEAQFTGDYAADWTIYEAVVMDWASRFHPNGMGDDQVWKDMKASAETVFRTVWTTAKLMASCTKSDDTGFTFYPSIALEADGMYHARFPLTEETRIVLNVSEITVNGDWHYRFLPDALDFYSSTGEVQGGYLARINPANANGIIAASIGETSVWELHQPVMVRGQWSLTYSQANLVSALTPGTCIEIRTEEDGESSSDPSFPSSGGVSRFCHSETWQADYIVNLRKLDAETGKSLEGAQFDVLEAFDDSQLEGSILEDDNWDNAGGSQFLRWDSWDSPYGTTGADPCPKDQEITDEDGWLTEMESAGAGPLQSNGIRSHHDVKYYSYTKGYCTGHPEPDEDDEEGMDEYEREIAVCENLERQGGFYHALGGGEAKLRADRDAHYLAFISLTYDYSARELTAREGYILHNQEQIHEPHETIFDGIHPDTIPIETVTVHASQYYALRNRDSRENLEINQEGEIAANIEGEIEETDNGVFAEYVEEPKASNSVWGFDPEILDEDAWMNDDTEEDEDAGMATESDATASDAELSGAAVMLATASSAMIADAAVRLPGEILQLDRQYLLKNVSSPSNLLRSALLGNTDSWAFPGRTGLRASGISPISLGNTDYGGSGADWIFEVYDYRTEGEIHANKRDLELKKGEHEYYDSSRDIQGDATLEGAVYGLFAAEDIVHPDGKTGVVYEKGNLTSVAQTDENGDFSFLAYTENPGIIYDYEQEKKTETGFSGPENLQGNCWVGRPLIMGAYYIQELKRSEGYELSVYGIEADVTNRYAWSNGGEMESRGSVSVTNIEEQVLLDPNTGEQDIVTRFTLKSQDAIHGYDIQLKGIEPAAGPTFFTTTEGTKDIYSEWQEPVIHYEPVEAESGTIVLIDGGYIPARVGDVVSLPVGEKAVVEQTAVVPQNSAQLILTGSRGAIPTFDIRYLPEMTEIYSDDPEEFLSLCNEAFKEIGFAEAGVSAPYLRIALGDDPSAWAEHVYQYLSDETCPTFNAARLEAIIYEDEMPYAVLRYSFLKKGEIQPVIYSASDDAFYVKYDIRYEDANGYFYRKYPVSEFSEENYELGNRLYQWILIDREKPEKERVELYESLEELEFVSAQEFISYWAYAPGDLLRNEDGSIYQKEVIEYEKWSGYRTEETFLETSLVFSWDSVKNAYYCHIAPEQIPEGETLLITIHYADIFAGNRTGLSVSAIPSMNTSGTYIQTVHLVYPGQNVVYEDAGTRKEPAVVLERIIKEKVKVTKTLENHESEFVPADGFRFRIYLKSNLERMYRNNAGEILWLDRDEQELSMDEILNMTAYYPEKVPKIITKKTADSYIPVLERNGQIYNYEKFFDAMAVANHDIWDDANLDFTSWRPIGNHPNRTEYTVENTQFSDAVRQFAIDWYLDEEVKACSAEAEFSDEFYDQALNEALVKAEDYLKPFFTYDLDRIYAIPWDSEQNGGVDQDLTTLSVNQRLDTGYCGISEYLPYGTYVVVEQQPAYAHLKDLKNRHYQIDLPKEIDIPAAPEPADIPWSVVDPGIESVEYENGTDLAEVSYRGYSSVKFHNQQYKSRLRIEKLDAVTHENLLHDSAVFRIYKAKRNEDPEGEGEVLFHEAPTMIHGSREFLEAMKAEHIQPMSRIWRSFSEQQSGPGTLYTGIVAAGTPVCEEADLVVMKDHAGMEIHTFSTSRTGAGKDEPTAQNVGYLETPQALSAGVYVLCEVKPPSGYVRTDPMAVEVYSDEVAYYQQGCRDQRVLAAVYEYEKDQKMESAARIFVENNPITLTVEKKKEVLESEEEKTITYMVNGRIEGTLTEIGNNPNYVYAYQNGEYLGYAWKKGTLEYLKTRQKEGEAVEIVYEGQNFAGYGYVARLLETAADDNPYVSGAMMTLYQSARLQPSGDTQDHAYKGLVIERNVLNEVVRMYVEETECDILFYDLDSLLIRKTEHSAVAYRGGIPYLEFVGGDVSRIIYHRKDRQISVGEGTEIYHLDRDGNRDSLVDPYTGMAYVKASDQNGSEAVFVWPVRIVKDDYGNIISRDKIRTCRIATVGENQDDRISKLEPETGYLTGSWNADQESESHRQVTIEHTSKGQNMQNEVLTDTHNGRFEKRMEPVYDEHGLVTWYRVNDKTYEKETGIHDRNGDLVRYYETEAMDEYHLAAYDSSEEIPHHRQGEAYVLENTWISSEKTPNDPFRTELTEGQADILKRIPTGDYILEELVAPDGYRKGLPVGISVLEKNEPQSVTMMDGTIKIEISKIDSTENYKKTILDMMQSGEKKGKLTVGLGEYSHGIVSGVSLALFKAERVYTTDFKRYPKGYYLKRKTDDPIRYFRTDNKSVYLEGVPEGVYILEEMASPEGFVRSEPVEVTVSGAEQVQTIIMYNDHTRIEVEKYTMKDGKRQLLDGAEFALYATDSSGERGKKLHTWMSSDCEIYRDFIPEFEQMYRDYGVMEGSSICWESRGKSYCAKLRAVKVSETGTKHPTSAILEFLTSDGKTIRITVYEKQEKRFGTDFVYEYQFEYQKLPEINERACAWLTLDSAYRLEYLPVGAAYVLVEEKAPEGYHAAADAMIQIADCTDIQRHSIENLPEGADLPEEPEVPAVPDEPDVPEIPATPSNPEEPDVPENPATPSIPDEPENPDRPDTPKEPGSPDGSDNPDGSGDPEGPDTPETPKLPPGAVIPQIQPFPDLYQRIGFISASYQPVRSHHWYSENDYGFTWLKFLPYLGDQSKWGYLIVVFMFSSLGILLCKKRKK